MPGRSRTGTTCAAAAVAALIVAGCAGEAQPRKDRPADRAAKQYAAGNLDDFALRAAPAGAIARPGVRRA